ncbi:MAG TPA: thaumatin family protein [Polyangiaceae bacterium]|jgi:hypothetical protein|nr:thaumatin family protein [Polyangiaceae bacterium]
MRGQKFPLSPVLFCSVAWLVSCSSGGTAADIEAAAGNAAAGTAASVTSNGGQSSSGSNSALENGGSMALGSGGGASGVGEQLPAMVDAGTAMPIGDQTLPRKLYLENHCTYAIWNFALPASTFPNNVPLELESGQAVVVGWPDKWSGRIWPRSECTGDPGELKCAQTGNDTLAEFTLTAGMNSDWYDISLVDGFTIPTGIIQMDAPWTPSPSYVPGGPLGADQQCGSPICAVDLNLNCPDSQQEKDATGQVVGCKNGQSSNGGHGPTPVTTYLKTSCPTSYTYPYDDPQSLFICPSAVQNGGKGSKDYKIIYCPTQGSTPGFP